MVVDTHATPGQDILVRHVDWAEYERILAEHASSSAPRFVYDHGVLEIMSPRREHERKNRALALLAMAAAEALGLEFDELGSTTFRRADLQRGFEADSCFYVQHADAMRGRDLIDPLSDPPPDLVVEIDVSRSTLDKLKIYVAFRVPEVWRCVAVGVEIYVLNGERYTRHDDSSILPGVTGEALSHFVTLTASAPRLTWLREIRAWAATLPR